MKLIKKDIPYMHWEYLHSESGDRLRIVPERGGLITEWRCKGREVIYFDRERFLDLKKSIRGGIPILFPICGNLVFDDSISSDWLINLKQHGFARDMSWELDVLDDSCGVKLTLFDNEFTRSVYPFEFYIQMEVRLILNSIRLSITIRNNGSIPMPYNFGLHPYFSINDLSNVDFYGLPKTCIDHNLKLEVETCKQLNLLEQGVDMICGPLGPVTLIDRSSNIRVKMDHKYPMDMTVIWTDPPRKMVCLEPWTSPRQSLINGTRRLHLEPGIEQNLFCEYTVLD